MNEDRDDRPTNPKDVSLLIGCRSVGLAFHVARLIESKPVLVNVLFCFGALVEVKRVVEV
jgi:hypothetical protein